MKGIYEISVEAYYPRIDEETNEPLGGLGLGTMTVAADEAEDAVTKAKEYALTPDEVDQPTAARLLSLRKTGTIDLV